MCMHVMQTHAKAVKPDTLPSSCKLLSSSVLMSVLITYVYIVLCKISSLYACNRLCDLLHVHYSYIFIGHMACTVRMLCTDESGHADVHKIDVNRHFKDSQFQE